MMSPETEKNPFVLVPLSVVSRRDLPANAKLLLAMVAGLCGRQGYCWATNAFLASRRWPEVALRVNLLAALEGKGLLRSVIHPERGNERRLYVRSEAPAGAAPRAPADTPPPAQTDVPGPAQTDVTGPAQTDVTPRSSDQGPDAQSAVTPHAQTCHQIDNSERIKEESEKY